VKDFAEQAQIVTQCRAQSETSANAAVLMFITYSLMLDLRGFPAWTRGNASRA